VGFIWSRSNIELKPECKALTLPIDKCEVNPRFTLPRNSGGSNMKFFIDTANLDEIKEAASIGILDGVTTNPTLLAKAKGQGDYKTVLKIICEVVDGPVSGEVVAMDAKGMVKEAEDLAKIHKNMVIKIPMCQEGLKAIKILDSKGIRTNCTLIFSPIQALLAAKAGASFDHRGQHQKSTPCG
jgi:TalC/MipB family fructose-6-phosphate aldolase